MRRMMTLGLAAVLVLPALPAMAAKPVTSDTVVFTWDDGDYVRYADGQVEVSLTETATAVCAGASVIQTTTISGTAPAMLDVKNHLGSGTIAVNGSGLVVEVESGCDIEVTSPSSLVIDFEFVESTVERTKVDGGRIVQRSGEASTSVAGAVAFGVVERLSERA